jgi:hypothetical protein
MNPHSTLHCLYKITGNHASDLWDSALFLHKTMIERCSDIVNFLSTYLLAVYSFSTSISLSYKNIYIILKPESNNLFNNEDYSKNAPPISFSSMETFAYPESGCHNI